MLTPAAVLGITNAAADFLAPCGIRVNDVAPAIVESPMSMASGRDVYFARELEAQSMFPRRFTRPAEIAEAIVFLLEHPMMNAHHLKVDAGWRQSSDWSSDPRKRHPWVE
jgi:3-hydroxyacyl-CoA dehydrogenase